VISKRKWLAYYRYRSYMNYVSPILVNRTSFGILTANQLAAIKCLEIQKTIIFIIRLKNFIEIITATKIDSRSIESF